MEKIAQYESYIIAILQEYATIKPVNLQNIDNQIIVDRQGHHYQLISMGWDRKLFSYSVVFHFDIKADGKIWIQANNTDADVAEALERQGVPKSDIVIGFQPPQYRSYTGYAAA